MVLFESMDDWFLSAPNNIIAFSFCFTRNFYFLIWISSFSARVNFCILVTLTETLWWLFKLWRRPFYCVTVTYLFILQHILLFLWLGLPPFVSELYGRSTTPSWPAWLSDFFFLPLMAIFSIYFIFSWSNSILPPKRKSSEMHMTSSSLETNSFISWFLYSSFLYLS